MISETRRRATGEFVFNSGTEPNAVTNLCSTLPDNAPSSRTNQH